MASFLLGVGSGSVTPAPALAQQTTYYALFVQDDFKVTPRLTLNLGLRYDYESPRTDRFNQLTNFGYGIKPPLAAPGLDLHGRKFAVDKVCQINGLLNPNREGVGLATG